MQQLSLRILISPLDWGLGHASRCIPVIRQLIHAGHKVTIAGYGRSLILLQKEFPLLESIELQGFSPSYPRSGNMILKLVTLLPKFVGTIISEHRELAKLIAKHGFDVVISDNRYGLHNKHIKSILITHQVMIKMPAWLKFAEYPVYRISRYLISRFNECWIPDSAECPGLSGDLSHKYQIPTNARFIGTISRFLPVEKNTDQKHEEKNITVIISGPEPQRSLFEEMILNQVDELNINVILVSGKPESEGKPIVNKKMTILPHLGTDELSRLIASSALIICRSGYSSLMDLQALQGKVLFVPTPCQTEQIYLAELHHLLGTALWRAQDELNLKTDIDEALKYRGFTGNTLKSGLEPAIAGLRKK